MSQDLLEVYNLTVNVGKFSLKDINFLMGPGDYVIILGPTGCGKTIFLESIAGLRALNKGALFLNGKEITHLPPEHRYMGFAYQDSLLYPFMSVKENILFGAKARKMAGGPEILRRMEQLAAAMNITHLLDRYPRFLSGGERQRVSLARAILTRPPLLLLDEPLSALDQQTRHTMQELLREIHHTEGIGIIHVTHDFSEALQLGKRMLVLHDGQVEQEGEPLEIFYHPATEFVAKFLHGENLIPGRVLRQGGEQWFEYGDGDFLLGPLPKNCLTEGLSKSGKLSTLLIRSGSIRLSRAAEGPAAANCWTARIKSVIIGSTHVDVYCNGNGRWQASLSLAEWQGLDLRRGEQVSLSVSPEHLHVIAQ
ncbi:Spermidine/putrescine import ATP-binding protein PotA [Pelotomaculum sp. FP]|uniref:ABC transporter ATP-binding protein n=1 Tax=Pelotomaculum sp. FP TaxID=261474 RepID=UPI001064FD4F|nr:ATP-binding cassette domain-containing protein [Pelotomaculum sp. FP]TEB15046.1 Spermidine/putrescine import ATP-binding protein PotA [Pelotomaculum sp. FP]